MPKFPRFLAVLATAAALAGPAAAQDTAADAAPDAATVIARVGAAELTLGHVIALRGQLPAQYQAAPDAQLFPVLVQQMIDQELLAQTRAGQLTATQQIQLDNELRSFLSNISLQAVVTAAVTPEALDQAYAAFSEAFSSGDPVPEWNAAHILVRTEDEIAAVVAALAEGREFAEVAREVSTDGSARQGGDLGWFGPGVMIPEFETTVRSLEPGQVSEPLQTRFGWHVVRLLDTRTASVPALDEVREQLTNELRREAVMAQLAELRAANTVEDLSEGLDPALLSRTELLAD